MWQVVTVLGESVHLSAKEYELVVAFAEDLEQVFKNESSSGASGTSAHSAGRGP